MLDWLTLRLPAESISPELRGELEALSRGQIMAFNREGEVLWSAPMRESVRSDSHQVTVQLGHGLEISGSPARVLYDSNVFGKGDPTSCASDMIGFVERLTGAALPGCRHWRCTRWDVTLNYNLGSSAEVRQGLSYLRLSEGGHFQVRTASETVYWGAGSRLRSGKAYHKGPHVLRQLKRREAFISDDDAALCDRLLRLELSHRAQWFRERARKAWYEFCEDELEALHAEYFGQVIGKIEVAEMDNLRERFEAVAPTPGQGLSAFRSWSLVRAVGLREAQASMTRSTWYRHKRVMFDAGLTWADLHQGNVVPFRRRVIELGQPVRSWEELRRAA